MVDYVMRLHELRKLVPLLRSSKVKSQENKTFNKIADGQLISAPPVLVEEQAGKLPAVNNWLTRGC